MSKFISKKGLTLNLVFAFFHAFVACQVSAEGWSKGYGATVEEAAIHSMEAAYRIVEKQGSGCVSHADTGDVTRLAPRSAGLYVVETHHSKDNVRCINASAIDARDEELKSLKEDVRFSYMPSGDTVKVLKNLSTEARQGVEQGSKSTDDASHPITLIVDESKLPKDRKKSISTNEGSYARVAFAVPNSMIIRFEDGTSKDDITNFLSERQASIISAQENIGTVQIETDLTKYFTVNLGDDSANDAYLRGLKAAVSDFNSDPRVKLAAPDLLMRRQQPYKEVLSASSHTFLNGSGEVVDWGVSDIQADTLWNLPGAENGVVIGIIDVGFARHDDIVFTSLSAAESVDDHGNHVSGIACGKHNGKGIKGVLPNCFVNPRSTPYFQPESSGDVLEFLQSFSQILSTLNEFIPISDDIRVFNISLGYNWIPNFGINTDDEVSADWRSLVASQGEIFISVLSLAGENGTMVFSAAGNDSAGLSAPISAKYASPMNWAAVTARERGIIDNGIIVEAHSPDGSRAGFSNVGGDLSCPGVSILSTVAHDADGEVSRTAYARMSGTSMASPFCAAGYALLASVRPRYVSRDLIDCVISTGNESDSGTPMMRLELAASACPSPNDPGATP